MVSGLLQLGASHFIYMRSLMLVEPWRWWTAHWVHVGWLHYLLNMLALAALPFIFPKVQFKNFLVTLLLFSPLLSLGLYLGLPQLDAYAGLSGVLHGIYVYAAFESFTQQRRERQFALLVLACVLVKVLTEKWFGYTETARLIQAPVLIESHQIGVLIGMCAGLWVFINKFYTKRLR